MTSIALAFTYDPTKLAYIGYTPNASLSTMIVNDLHIDITHHKVTISWADFNGSTLTNNQVLANISFTYIAAPLSDAPLSFVTAENEYLDINGDHMNHMALDAYYFNGAVTNTPLGTLSWAAPIPVTNVCAGSTYDYEVSVAGGGTPSTYAWTIPAGSQLVSNQAAPPCPDQLFAAFH